MPRVRQSTASRERFAVRTGAEPGPSQGGSLPGARRLEMRVRADVSRKPDVWANAAQRVRAAAPASVGRSGYLATTDGMSAIHRETGPGGE